MPELDTAAQDAAIILAMAERKNAAAVALGRRRAKLAGSEGMASIGRIGGRAGGPARASKLSPKRRREIAQAAAKARWEKKGEAAKKSK